MPQYFKEVQAELKHVSWPSRKMVIVYTAIVIAISVAVAVYLGVLDAFFTAIVKRIV